MPGDIAYYAHALHPQWHLKVVIQHPALLLTSIQVDSSYKVGGYSNIPPIVITLSKFKTISVQFKLKIRDETNIRIFD